MEADNYPPASEKLATGTPGFALIDSGDLPLDVTAIMTEE